MPVTWRAARWLLVPVVMAGGPWLGVGCGGRSSIPIPPPAPDCYVDADCEGAEDRCNPVFCDLLPPDQLPDGGLVSRGGTCVQLTPVDCDDGDPCTADTCLPETGQCTYGPATFDNDGDGFLGPRPGTKPGDPDACGDDCDDTNPAAYPGGEEVCDGVDNDCDGTVDNGASFIPLGDGDAVRISGNVAPASTGGLAWSGTSYAAVYSGNQQGFSVFRTMLDPAGNVLPPGEGSLTPGNGDASGGPIVWVGDRYGMVWQDRRTGAYQIYFTLLDASGNKVEGGDRQLTNAPGFSVNVALTWNGAEFVAVWQDERNGLFNLYAQRLDIGANLLGDNTPLTEVFSGIDNEGPSVAAGGPGMAVAWTANNGFQRFIRVQLFHPDLTPASDPVDLTDGFTDSVFPTVVWNRDRFVVAWYDKTRSPTAIYGAVLSEEGQVLVPTRPITSPGSFRSRYPFLRPLGDRVLVVYADDRDQNDGYEIYSTMVGADLMSISPEQRITFAPRNSIQPVATFGPAGELGILFRDDRQGENHMFFSRLGCVAETP
ncbi:putative metal-binding motif-containing protein [Chondromyces crocatus]|uniref:Lipoprotein n=1 Tax=Chondromyces crocatus TaxID=52 RepID=A0A0K1EJM9_CHOCO|nr:putative metal-binding motif-containing protein [Chondromyces crocatus]AKT40897.1 uncharacterized protein CMC5_050540 [Chondromyces crocatus]